MLETKPIVRGPREEFRGQKCIARREKCIFIKALPGGKVESGQGGSAWEDSDGARGWTVFAGAVAAVLAGLAF